MYVGCDLAKMGENQKNDESLSLLKVFLGSGIPFDGHVGPSWRYVRSFGRHLGATWRQDVPYERQDEARWRKWAARERNWEPQGGSNPRQGTRVGGGPLVEVSRLGTPDSDFSWNWRLRLQLDLQTPTANGTG